MAIDSDPRNTEDGLSMLISSLSTLDYVIVGIPILLTLLGMTIGANKILLSWPPRFLMTLWLAPVLVMALLLTLYVMEFRMLLTGIPPIAANIVYLALYLVTFVIIFWLLGRLRRFFQRRIDRSSSGPFFDRLAGIPGGLVFGSVLVTWLIIAPAALMRGVLTDEPALFQDSQLLIPLADFLSATIKPILIALL